MSEHRQGTRGRLGFAVGAAFLLAVVIGVVVATGSSDGEPEITDECILAWNEDPVAALESGAHAYDSHGYRATLVTRVDADGNVLESAGDDEAPDDPDARCAVIFAAPELDFEPGFGVFLFEDGLWRSIVLAERFKVEQVEELQAEALPVTNSTLLPSGKLAQD